MGLKLASVVSCSCHELPGCYCWLTVSIRSPPPPGQMRCRSFKDPGPPAGYCGQASRLPWWLGVKQHLLIISAMLPPQGDLSWNEQEPTKLLFKTRCPSPGLSMPGCESGFPVGALWGSWWFSRQSAGLCGSWGLPWWAASSCAGGQGGYWINNPLHAQWL